MSDPSPPPDYLKDRTDAGRILALEGRVGFFPSASPLSPGPLFGVRVVVELQVRGQLILGPGLGAIVGFTWPRWHRATAFWCYSWSAAASRIWPRDLVRADDQHGRCPAPEQAGLSRR
jgi:hypothetical protein